MTSKPDAIEILVSHQAAALVRHGTPLDRAQAEAEAEDIVAGVLADLNRIGLQDVYLGVALRRAKVYRLRCQGHTFRVICERLGVTRQQAAEDYRREMLRRRTD